jgi:hypothetical protein
MSIGGTLFTYVARHWLIGSLTASMAFSVSIVSGVNIPSAGLWFVYKALLCHSA